MLMVFSPPPHTLIPIPHADDTFIKDFRRDVAQHYIQYYCHIRTDPWTKDQLELRNYFTNLTLPQEDIHQAEPRDVERHYPKSDRKLSHDEIFAIQVKDQYPKRNLVYGEAGSGKTTLCKKLAYDWAMKTASSP